MSEKNNSFPVFMMFHEEKTVSGTISDKSYDKPYIDMSMGGKSELESKGLQEDNLTRVGTAYMQKDGSIYIQLYATPLNGKIIIKATKS